MRKSKTTGFSFWERLANWGMDSARKRQQKELKKIKRTVEKYQLKYNYNVEIICSLLPTIYGFQARGSVHDGYGYGTQLIFGRKGY